MSNRFNYATCEPFRAWNRLEPRSRKAEFERSLKTEIHDPLWMLTRQWQFGEFKGEDTGSPIFAKLKIKSAMVSRYRSHDSTAENYNDQVPLETIVESEKIGFDYHDRIQAAAQWLKILKLRGKEFNQASSPAVPFTLSDYLQKLITIYPLENPSHENEDDPTIAIQKAKLRSNARLQQLLTTFQGRTFDGVKLLQQVQLNLNDFVNELQIDASHRNFLLGAAGDFMAWAEKRFSLNTNRHSAWKPDQLEYQFACAVPNTNGNNTVIQAEEYFHGKLDWYAFDIDSSPDPASGLIHSSPAIRAKAIQEEVLSVIPTEAQFAGMPHARWWEFEDGNVDLGNINAETTDIAKILLAEFALLYGNNWFVVPYSIKAGSLSEVEGIVVKDVFGEQTLVKPAVQGEHDDWSAWGMFNLGVKNTAAEGPSEADTRLFLPPVLARVQEGPTLEEVKFIRDEMANFIWAIETKIADLTGKGQDGHAAAAELKNYLIELEGLDEEELREKAASPDAVFKYILSNTVPENWIPFQPVHVGNANRAIELQRASMPRLFRDSYQPVRPRTEILRVGIHTDPSAAIHPYVNPTADVQDQPYYINEEEISKTGIRVIANHQRTRWYQGKTFNWLGRRKKSGRGEGSSGLQFDRVIRVQKNKANP